MFKYLFVACTLDYQSAGKKIIYFKLKNGSYQKSSNERYVTLKSTRKVCTYSFTIPYSGINGGILGFYHHNNPETGTIMEPIKLLTLEQLNELDFISFDGLIALMKKNDVDFNNKFILYFVEPGERNYMYQVYKSSYFADNDVDVIHLDSTKVIPNN